MQIFARHRAYAGAQLFALAVLLGCAASPVDPEDDAGLLGEESPIDEADASAPREPDAEPADDDTSDQEPPAREAGAAPTTRDATIDGAGEAPPAPEDAATPVRDARSAEGTPPAPRDAAAAAVDAASPSAEARDASQPARDASPGDAAARDAATPSMPNNRCQRSSDCNALCAFTGILPCCREDRTCGCTWAPGAYCL